MIERTFIPRVARSEVIEPFILANEYLGILLTVGVWAVEMALFTRMGPQVALEIKVAPERCPMGTVWKATEQRRDMYILKMGLEHPW